MSKIVFFDIDGTLHYSGIGIPQSAVKCIESADRKWTQGQLCAQEEAKE